MAPSVSGTSNGRAPEFCRQADAPGLLESLGINLGECVTVSRIAADQNPIANDVNAGLCAVDFVAEGRTKGECLHDLDPSSHVPFRASLVRSLDTGTWTVTGVGTGGGPARSTR